MSDGASLQAPGPGGNPLTDQLLAFEADPLAFLERMHAEFGDVVRLRMWPELYHLISHPDEVRRILVTDAHRYHAEALPVTPPGDHDLPSAADAEAHPAQRFHHVAREVFHRGAGVTGMVPTITASIADSMAAWAGPAQAGTPIDVAAEMATLTLAVLGRALLGVNLADDVAPLARAFAVAATSGPLQRRMSVYQALQRSQEVADPALVDAARVVDTIVRRLIDDRRQTGDGAADLLTRLVFDRETDERGRLVTDEQLLMVVRVLLIAGHSAASSALAWTFHLVGEHPLVRARLESEIHTVLAGRVPMASDLPLLRYTRMVLLEAMRLYPPVWMLLPRRAARADRLGGYDIPRGTKVVISPWVLHRHPEFWARPEEFNPDRFSRTEPRAFLPFGAGPWGCVGTQFGLTEARLALAMAIQRYSWAAAVPGRPVVPDPQVALWPRDGLPMLFQQREKGSGQAPP